MGSDSSKSSDIPFAYIYKKNSTEQLSVRELKKTDFSKGFTQTLASHFKVEEKDILNAEIFANILSQYPNTQYYLNKILVIEDLKAKNVNEAVVATARLVIRPSLVNHNIKVAHIEELALRSTREDFNHHDSYPVLLGALTDIATYAKVYKITNYPHGGWNYYSKYGTFEEKIFHGDYLPNDDDRKRIVALSIPPIIEKKLDPATQTKLEKAKPQDTPNEKIPVAPATRGA